MNSKTRVEIGLLAAVACASWIPQAHATSAVHYYHATVCQEQAPGESGFINRRFDYVRNEDVADVIRTVICPVTTEDLASGTGTNLSVTFNVYSATGGTQTYAIRRHNQWGSILEYNSIAALGSGNASWTMAVTWLSTAYYSFAGGLPSRYNSQDFRFYSYSVQRL